MIDASELGMRTEETPTGFEKLNVLVVDDEPLARTHLSRTLRSLNVGSIIEIEDSSCVAEAIERDNPNLVLLDIQMPGSSGLDVAGEIAAMDNPPMIVFVTGYSQHAVEAFEKQALDYLLKPVSADRLSEALRRGVEKINDLRLIREAAARRRQEGPPPGLNRLPVRSKYSIRFIRIDRILYAEARQKQVTIITRDGEENTYYTLSQLASILPPRFMRIHASCIVDVEHIQELLLFGNHSYSVKLSDGAELPVSRASYRELQRRLGLVE